MKPTELQKKICEHIITEVKYWRDTNDIDSPTHAVDLHDCLLAELGDDLNELELTLYELLNVIRSYLLWNMLTKQKEILYILMSKCNVFFREAILETEVIYKFWINIWFANVTLFLNL